MKCLILDRVFGVGSNVSGVQVAHFLQGELAQALRFRRLSATRR
jgi:hypothetical protein